MKNTNHIKFSFLWIAVISLAINMRLSIEHLLILTLSCNLPDFDALDYVFLSTMRILLRNNTIYHLISREKYTLLRKSLLSLGIISVGIFLSIILNNYRIILIFLYVSIFVHLKHRTFTHSILGLIIISIVSIISINNSKVCFLIITGYLFHIIQDLLTYTGVHLYFPIKKKVSLLRGKYKNENGNNKINKKLTYVSISTSIILLALKTLYNH